MPLPKRKPGERKKEFIIKCMDDPKMVSEYPDNKQRAAICYMQASK